MTLPISFRQPELRNLDEGRLRFFRRRRAGALARVEVGTRLWIREPFLLPGGYDDLSPTAARDRGAMPVFLDAVAYRDWERADLGRQRMARELCRDWHRRHLVVTAIVNERLHDVTADDLRAMGFTCLAHYRDAWRRDVSGMIGRGAAWEDNPSMLRFSFDLVDTPVAKEAAPKQPVKSVARREPRPKAPQRAQAHNPVSPQARPVRQAQPAPLTPRGQGTRSFCDQCQALRSPAEVRSCESRWCSLRHVA